MVKSTRQDKCRHCRKVHPKTWWRNPENECFFVFLDITKDKDYKTNVLGI